MILHSLGLARNFPLAVVHAGVADMGLGIDDFTCVHGVAQLQLLLGHLNKRDRTGQLLQIERDYIELVVGTGACSLDTPAVTTLPHCPDTCMMLVCGFLHSVGGSVDTASKQVIPPQRERDQYVMQLAVDRNFDIKAIQRCRLWL